jgi:hypothetical protein
MTGSDHDDLVATLERYGRRHGWNVTHTTLGYYRLRFANPTGTIAVRISVTGRITDVTVNLHGKRYQLSLPARRALEGLLSGQEVPA